MPLVRTGSCASAALRHEEHATKGASEVRLAARNIRLLVRRKRPFAVSIGCRWLRVRHSALLIFPPRHGRYHHTRGAGDFNLVDGRSLSQYRITRRIRQSSTCVVDGVIVIREVELGSVIQD